MYKISWLNWSVLCYRFLETPVSLVWQRVLHPLGKNITPKTGVWPKSWITKTIDCIYFVLFLLSSNKINIMYYSYVLFVVMAEEWNMFDQRSLEYELWTKWVLKRHVGSNNLSNFHRDIFVCYNYNIYTLIIH